MNKSVLISIKDVWCEKIISGEKTIEVRKTRPKIETPFKCYIYCTKEGLLIVGKDNAATCYCGNRYVIGEFVCDAIYPIRVCENGYSIQNWNHFGLYKSCLSLDEMANYIGRNKTGYGWHISKLKIYDKPRGLNEFCRPCPDDICTYCDYYDIIEKSGDYAMGICNSPVIKRPPQSWCYVKEI